MQAATNSTTQKLFTNICLYKTEANSTHTGKQWHFHKHWPNLFGLIVYLFSQYHRLVYLYLPQYTTTAINNTHSNDLIVTCVFHLTDRYLYLFIAFDTIPAKPLFKVDFQHDSISSSEQIQFKRTSCWSTHPQWRGAQGREKLLENAYLNLNCIKQSYWELQAWLQNFHFFSVCFVVKLFVISFLDKLSRARRESIAYAIHSR